jgi:hypothetical protein
MSFGFYIYYANTSTLPPTLKNDQYSMKHLNKLKFTAIAISTLFSFSATNLTGPTPRVYDTNLNPLPRVSRAVALDHPSITKRFDGFVISPFDGLILQ